MEIIAALKAIAALPELIKLIGEEIRSMRDAITEKNLSTFKAEVRSELTNLAGAKNKEERIKFLEALNKKVSK